MDSLYFSSRHSSFLSSALKFLVVMSCFLYCLARFVSVIVFFASLLWELIFHLIQFKAVRRGGVFYLLLGVICGGLVIFIVHVNIGEINSQGWLNAIPTVIGSMSIMGVSALIFYIIRRGLE